jgi:hypothetical protein
MTNETSLESIQEVLTAIVRPLSESVGGLNTKFDDHRLKTAERLADIQATIKQIRLGYQEQKKEIVQIREGHAECVARANWPLVDRLIKQETDTAAIRLSQQTTKRSDPCINIPLTKSAARWIPYLIISALLGAAFVGAALIGRTLNPLPAPAVESHVAQKSVPEDEP